ncbi:unnamed protein product [Schistocephalus solidus]|uniref:Uncharacterized protein n=1 Tax=Schistocephalus solidus TaxID=70667 RepID=A0A3P7CXM5_SCHSO|nr:unnamed protein product [Schistocephalus solidus]
MGLQEISDTSGTSLLNRISEICKTARKRRSDFEARITALYTTTSLSPSARDQELEHISLSRNGLVAVRESLFSSSCTDNRKCKFFFGIMGGWMMEVMKVGLYLAIPLAVLTMSNMPRYLERNHEAQRLSVYEQTGGPKLDGDTTKKQAAVVKKKVNELSQTD